MLSLKKQEKGFTIIELMVVTLVILGLGFLMFNSLSDVRGRGYDTERRSDVNLLSQQLEFYYDLGETSTYPTLANLQDENWVKENLKGLEAEALTDPAGVKIGEEGSDYTYEPTNCGDTGCASFTLSADLDKTTPDPYVKKSVNQ